MGYKEKTVGAAQFKILDERVTIVEKFCPGKASYAAVSINVDFKNNTGYNKILSPDDQGFLYLTLFSRNQIQKFNH